MFSRYTERTCCTLVVAVAVVTCPYHADAAPAPLPCIITCANKHRLKIDADACYYYNTADCYVCDGVRCKTRQHDAPCLDIKDATNIVNLYDLNACSYICHPINGNAGEASPTGKGMFINAGMTQLRRCDGKPPFPITTPVE